MKRMRCAFTLIELLVVVAIIALLIAILLPSLGQAREHAKTVACSSNLRSMGLAMVMYYQDNNNIFPTVGGAYGSTQTANTSDWLLWQPQFRNVPTGQPSIATSGIGCYMLTGNTPSNLKSLYCPSDQPNIRPNAGATGAFNYSYLLNWYALSGCTTGGLVVDAPGAARNIGSVKRPSEFIVFYEESEFSINDSTGTMWRIPGCQHWIDRLAYRHDPKDMNPAKEPSTNDNGGELIPNSKVKGNVAFSDGHAEIDTRAFVHSKAHALPNPDLAASMSDPAYQ